MLLIERVLRHVLLVEDIEILNPAVEDCLCALRWVTVNAAKYHFDVQRLVVTGESAGRHLPLTTGTVPESAGFDRRCPGVPLPKAAAVVDWSRITDVAGLLDGPDRKDYAVAWLGSHPDREMLARKLSPLTYARADGRPVLLIHGDADPLRAVVPLHEPMDRAGVRNRLLTIRGGGHGHFSPTQQVMIYGPIGEFLKPALSGH